MKKIFSVIGISLLVAAGAGVAHADTFVWKDQTNGFTFSFPDSWTIQSVDQPTTRIRIAGPIGEDWATCRVKAEKDGRLKIYPKRLMTEAVKETLDKDFWDHEVAEHEGGTVMQYRAPTGLGSKGDATAVRHAFYQDTDSAQTPMFGEMIGSIYGDMRYVISCSSKAAEFEKYAPVFASIMGSMDFDSKYHPFATGYYRDFLSDPKLVLPRTKPGTITERQWFRLQRAAIGVF